MLMDTTPATPTRNSTVTLREVTKENLYDVLDLKVTEYQDRFVANNAKSLAEAHFHDEAWFRAIYADETPVGFAMLSVDAVKPYYYLWRFMVDVRYQKQGYGRQALLQIIEHVKTLPDATSLELSYHKDDGGPEPFYARLGFVNTGEIVDDEYVMRLDWTQG